MANITSKELTAIEDQLNLERNLVKKYQTYASMCTDPQIKSTCEQVAGQHQNHYNKLLCYLN